MDVRVCTAGIRLNLGFARLELTNVPEKLSVTNFYWEFPERSQ